MKSIKDWQVEIGEWAARKGWDTTQNEFGTTIALMHTELSEALEEHRYGRENNEVWENWERGKALAKEPIEDDKTPNVTRMIPKPEGIPIELADLVIRVLHFCHENNINLDEMIQLKMEYNELRPHRHGGKVA